MGQEAREKANVSEDVENKEVNNLKLEVLHLGIALLIGGNPFVQQKFLDELMN